MKNRFLSLSLAAFSLGLGLSLPAAETKPAYQVVLDLKITTEGTVDDAVVFSSDDTTVDRVLERTAMEEARVTKLPPHLKDGKAVTYTARAPYRFEVPDDEGADSNRAPRPSIHSAIQPVYPPELAASGETGGVIFEAVISNEGAVKSLTVLRSSNPAFEKAATEAVKQWKFTPALKDGEAVNSRWRLAISFQTDVKTADWKWRLAPRPSLGAYAVVHRTLPPEPPASLAAPVKAPDAPASK